MMARSIYQNGSNMGRRYSASDRRTLSNPSHIGIERRINGDRRKGIRRRNHARFQAKDLTFVRLRSESDSSVAQMTDISKTGLSFRYFIDLEKRQDYSNLDIFVSESDFTISSIPFQTVSSAVLNGSAFSTTVMKRCGVRFNALSSEQTAKLDRYLLNHTLGEA